MLPVCQIDGLKSLSANYNVILDRIFVSALKTLTRTPYLSSSSSKCVINDGCFFSVSISAYKVLSMVPVHGVYRMRLGKAVLLEGAASFCKAIL